MWTVEQAQQEILQRVQPLPVEQAPVGPELLGRILAEEVASDQDWPPYDKALMDGYAVRTADLPAGAGRLRVVEEVMAGQVPRRVLGPGEATRLMTGAPVPAGADAVVMVEQTQLQDTGEVLIRSPGLAPGQNLLRRGQELRQGQVLLRAGCRLRAVELGLLALAGRTQVAVYPAPEVAVMTTGDEVVEASVPLQAGQIRNSNGPMLVALAVSAGARPRYLGIGRDRPDSLRPMLEKGLAAPVLLVSGGVSAGKLDLVPGLLRELQVTVHFHHVALKPGKPMLFGTRGATLVFALPGNPVSALVCFELFVRPALRRLQGEPVPGPLRFRARLQAEVAYHSARPTWHPAHLRSTDSGWQVQPVPWRGSFDLGSLAQANALVCLPPRSTPYRQGEWLEVTPLDGSLAAFL
jgi:molybdopterin molybdotransferase